MIVIPQDRIQVEPAKTRSVLGMCLGMYLLRFRKIPGWSSNIYQASRRKIWGNRDHSLDAMSSNTPRTFYGRSLPQNLVDYRSTESKTRLCRALQTGHAVPYLSLSSCFNTQAEPAYCGVSTLAIILNALRIDPQRIWRTIWRWFTEELLECCRPLEDVKVSGITLEEFVCLAHCNGAEATLVRPNDSNEQYKKFIQILERVCTGGKEVKGETFDEENPEEFMAISYSRKTLGQTGDGHFSPVAAMDKESNSVLMFDTARFKYPPYWVPMEVLFQSMLPLDSVTGKSRGYVVLKAKYEYQGRKVACNWSECNSLADCPENDLPVPKPVYKSGQWHCGNWPCSGGPCDTIKPT